jgi:F0F1-type ATP synthase assembly protein I
MLASAMNTCRDTALRVSAANGGRLRTTALTRHHCDLEYVCSIVEGTGYGLVLDKMRSEPWIVLITSLLTETSAVP